MPRPLINPADVAEAARLHEALDAFEEEVEPLPGLAAPEAREVFVAQLIDSLRRNRFIEHLRTTPLSDRVLDPTSTAFNPLMGAIVMQRAAQHDEACWLIFLYTHFGRHRRNHWALAARFYGKLGQDGLWNWAAVQGDIQGVRTWLDSNYAAMRAPGGGFGNHRKYESLQGMGGVGTGETIQTYVQWVGESHSVRFAQSTDHCSDAGERFDALYDSLRRVSRFGRVARFDYLSTLGKLGLTDITPNFAYFSGSTGPTKGARLIYDGFPTGGTGPATLESKLRPFREILDVPYDVLEDALCNWQKSPTVYVPFRG